MENVSMQVGDADDGREQAAVGERGSIVCESAGAERGSKVGLGEVEESDSNGVGGGDEAVDNSGEESDDEEDEPVELNEDTLVQLKCNDPSVTALDAYFHFGRNIQRFDSCSVDWEKEGNCMGENTYLRSLSVECRPRHGEDDFAVKNIESFYRGVSRNRSIKHLMIDGCSIDEDNFFAILSPFLEHNSNLRSIDLWSFSMDTRSTHLLASALSRRSNKQSLRGFAILDSSNMDDESAETLVDAVAMYCNLKVLSLYFSINAKKWPVILGKLGSLHKLEDLTLGHNDIDDEAAAVLANGLANNNTLKKLSLESNELITTSGWIAFFVGLRNFNSLEELNLSENDIDGEGLKEMANALVNMKELKHLDIGKHLELGYTNESISTDEWQTFFNLMRNANHSLEELNLSGNSIDDEAVAAMVDCLANMSSLKTLHLSSCSHITTAGWRAFFSSLQNNNSALEYLNLATNNIGDCTVATMVDVLANMSSLTELNLTKISQITASGWMRMSNLFQQPNSILEKLYLSSTGNHINDEVVIAFANALVNNTSLSTLQFGNGRVITARGWAALSDTLCNKASIDNIFSSNHTLQEVFWVHVEEHLPGDLASYLRLNENNNKVEVARQKILKHHFSNGESNVEDLVNMDMKVLPRAMSWIGRDVDGFLLLYQVVHSMPTLFDSGSKAKSVGGKRKRV